MAKQKRVRTEGTDWIDAAAGFIGGGRSFVPGLGGGSIFGQATLAHGLTRLPTCVNATSEYGEAFASVQTMDGTNFLCTTKMTPQVAGNPAIADNPGGNVHWLAWG